jgi:hypothetical protein
MRYRVNAPQVISETIDAETMIVNLATGHYFNVQGAGVELWECVVREESIDEIVARLEAVYEAGSGEIEAAVSTFLTELASEELIVPAEDLPRPAPAAPTPAAKRLPFTLPPVGKFTDMQDIILLDPVHEVEPRGWPHAPATA